MNRILIFFSALFFMTIGLGLALPDIGGDRLSPAEEQEWGEAFFYYVQQTEPVLQDALVETYLEDLGFLLAAHSPNPAQHFYFFIVKDPTLNAFAGPDGYIGVHSGLILFTKTEAELAAILAHEISHVTEQHLVRAMKKAKTLAIGALGAILGAIFTGNPDIIAGTATGSIAGSADLGIRFTQEQEQEADRVGIQTLAASGFNPQAMITLFKRMQYHFNDDGGFEFLSTHPFFPSRIADAQNQGLHYHLKNKPSSLHYELIKARLAAETTSDIKVLLHTKKNILKKNPDNPVAQYGYALALAVNHHHTQAIDILMQLTKKYPDELFYSLTLIEILQQNELTDQAVYWSEKVYAQYPEFYPALMVYVRTLIQNKNPEKAAKILKQHVTEYSDNLSFLDIYSHALGLSHDLVNAYRVRADAYLLVGNQEAAIGQLEIALQQPTISDYEKTMIKAKMEEIRSHSLIK